MWRENLPSGFLEDNSHRYPNSTGAYVYLNEKHNSLFRKPKKLTKAEHLNNKIKNLSKKKSIFHQTLLDWYCQTIFDFCKEEYITLNCQKHIFKRL